MENVISGTYVTPPPHNAAIVIKTHNFGYSVWQFPNKSSKVTSEFLGLTHCREILNNSRLTFSTVLGLGFEKFMAFDYDKTPFFYASPIPIEVLAFLFKHIEDRGGIKTRALFQSTDEPGLIAIFPGRFWGGVYARFGLFTCLLRGCCKIIKNQNYYQSSWRDSVSSWIEKAMNSDEYLINTRSAIDKFMSGCTFITNPSITGDWNFYMSKTKNHSLMVDPTKFSHDEYIGYVKSYAHRAWERLGKIRDKDSEIWAVAERYAAMNACR